MHTKYVKEKFAQGKARGNAVVGDILGKVGKQAVVGGRTGKNSLKVVQNVYQKYKNESLGYIISDAVEHVVEMSG